MPRAASSFHWTLHTLKRARPAVRNHFLCQRLVSQSDAKSSSWAKIKLHQTMHPKTQQAVRVATQYASAPPCKLTISSHLFARWHLSRHDGYFRHQQELDLWLSDLESGVLVTRDVGYLCANFSLPRPLCSRVRPDVRDRQTDRQTSDKSIA